MAQVQYYVMYRPMHPKTNKPIIYTDSTYTPYFNIMMTSLGTTPNAAQQTVQTNAVIAGGDSNNILYDALFVYNGVTKGSTTGGGAIADYVYDVFTKFKGDVWVVHSIQPSISEAMKIAEPLIMDLGATNVKLFKSAEMDIQVVLSKK